MTSYDFVYIGLEDEVGDNQMSSYKWTVDNSTLTYHNFYRNQPDTVAERCVAISLEDDLEWHDVRCSAGLVALCEAGPVSMIHENCS